MLRRDASLPALTGHAGSRTEPGKGARARAKAAAESSTMMIKAKSAPALHLPAISGARAHSPRMQRAVKAHLRRRLQAEERCPVFTLEPVFRSKYASAARSRDGLSGAS